MKHVYSGGAWAALASLVFFFDPSTSLALGECGMSCCLGAAATSGVTLAPNLGVSLQYEMSDMETLKSGTGSLAPDSVLTERWSMGNAYSVPTKMTMKKLTLTLAKPVTERLTVLGFVPYVINDMSMRMKSSMGMVMDHDMDQVRGIGDVSVLAYYTVFTDAPIRPEHRFSVGGGLKFPTGKNDVKTASGSYVHAMMQPGSGSWDPILALNYLRAWYPLILQANLLYHWTTVGDEGYRFGSQFTYEVASRYQVHDYVNLGLDLTGIIAGADEDREGKYTRLTSMVDNPGNTGLHSIFLSPVLQGKIPGTAGSLELKFQLPIYQRMNGVQQVLDSRWLASLTWGF